MTHVLNDAMMAFIGFTFGNLLAADYIYKRRIYIVERLHFEKQQGFNRFTFNAELENGKLPDEYPFAEYITLKDQEIIEDRVHPKEMEEEKQKVKENMDKI